MHDSQKHMGLIVLRWLLFMPAAVAASLGVTLVLTLLWGAGVSLVGGSFMSVGVGALANALGAFAGVMVAAAVAPTSSRPIIPASIAAAVFVVWAGLGIWMDRIHAEPASSVVQQIALIVGSIACLAMVVSLDGREQT